MIKIYYQAPEEVQLNWDESHSNSNGLYKEPEIVFTNSFNNPAYDDTLLLKESFDEQEVCSANNEYDNNWPFPKDGNGNPDYSIWHIKNDYSGLKEALDKVPKTSKIVRIAHFDTGYDPAHQSLNGLKIRHDLERNFIEENLPRSAVDSYSEGLLRQPGHGTGTLSILAESINPQVEIVPMRISKSVILVKNSSFVEALEEVIRLNKTGNEKDRIHIVTMSMGGLASQKWKDVINEAYEEGIFIVSAAGNNFGRTLPRTLVYPARFKRVVAACGVTSDFSPYFKPFELQDVKVMQGCFGPKKVMNTSIAAFTPNMPWAKIGCSDVVSMAGAGTSSATPQIAAAAALYYQKFHDELEALPEKWMRVEAIRFALFNSSTKKINYVDDEGTTGDELIFKFFGNGILNASYMLDIAPKTENLVKEVEDKVSFPFIMLLSEIAVNEFLGLEDIEEGKRIMFETEILQLIQISKELQILLDHEEKEVSELSLEEQYRFAEIIISMPECSTELKNTLLNIIKK